MMAYEPKGIKFFDAISSRLMILVADDEDFAGWLCYQHPDGQWVSLRKATADDIAKISEQTLKQRVGNATDND